MYNEIIIEPEQLELMLDLVEEYGTAGDILTACTIYKAGAKRAATQAGGNWAHLAGLGEVLRIGYILGQRAERRRTHTHTHRSAL